LVNLYEQVKLLHKAKGELLLFPPHVHDIFSFFSIFMQLIKITVSEIVSKTDENCTLIDKYIVYLTAF